MAMLIPACASPPTSVQLLAEHPDFKTPETAGRSFLAALSCNNSRTEYICMAEGLKSRYGATYDKWLVARKELLAELGSAVGQAHRLEPLSTQADAEGVWVIWGYGPHELGLLMTSQDFWDLEISNGEKWGSFLTQPISETVSVNNRELTIKLADPLLRGFPPQADVSRFIIETEWKVLDILPAERISR